MKQETMDGFEKTFLDAFHEQFPSFDLTAETPSGCPDDYGYEEPEATDAACWKLCGSCQKCWTRRV